MNSEQLAGDQGAGNEATAAEERGPWCPTGQCPQEGDLILALREMPGEPPAALLGGWSSWRFRMSRARSREVPSG